MVQRFLRTTTMLAAVTAVAGAAMAAPKSKPGASEDGAQPKLLGQYGEWHAYTAAPEGGKVCFALGKPKSSTTNPAGRKRDPAYIFISTRPAEKVRNEISIIIGYQFRQDSEATAEIDKTRFSMYTQRDGAWVKNVSEEARLVEAMRKGSELTVKGVSSRNTQSTDVYSLKGITQAIDRAEQECK